MRILLFVIAAVAAVTPVTSDDPCSAGACYPPSGDLLLGRGHDLRASSTCGLTGAEVFCTPYQQWKMKCCPCDSRNPAGRVAHTIQDVLTGAGHDRWWQSQKDINPVSIQLDLHNLFQLDTLMLSFKGPRPDALAIERTVDNGTTWQPALYLATHCSSSFPGIPTAPPTALDQTYCRTLPPSGPHGPYRDHTVQFSPLQQYSNVNFPKGQKIQEVGGITGLRVWLMELGAVPKLAGRALSKFYAVREMRVTGSCLCHGHAHRCLPHPSANTQVHSQCACEHNTAGVNCERCADLYNDLPWRAAEGHNTHICKRCECNSHAARCRFDAALYRATGSGGVCEGCGHNTAGVRCERCAPGYRPNPHSATDRPDACIPESVCPDNTYGDHRYGCLPCQCDLAGSASPQGCDRTTGACLCRPGVAGVRCDACQRGRCGHFPRCDDACPSCFAALDAHIHNLTQSLETLGERGGRLPPSPTGGDLGLRIQTLEVRVRLLQDSVSLLSSSPDSMRKISRVLAHLRERVDQMDSDVVLPLHHVADLERELEGLRALLESLVRTFNTQRDAIRNATSSTNTGALADIQKAVAVSRNAASGVEASEKTLSESRTARDQTTTGLLPHSNNTEDLEKLRRHLLASPDLSPAAKQVCGSKRATPCTPLQCDGGEVCPSAPPCGGGGEGGCVGALPLGRRSLAHAQEVKDRLERLSRKIAHAAEKLKETQGTSNQVRRSTEKLANRIKLARDDLEVDLKETRDVIKDLKDFLSDPSSSLQSVTEVSELVLGTRLPLGVADLRRKLDELRRLAATALPAGGAVLREAEPQLLAARRLLQEARDARDAAVGVTADVDGLLEGFSSAEGALSGLEDKLHSAMDIIDKLNHSLVKATVQLSPAEVAIEQLSELTGRMKPQLTRLRALLLAGDQLSQHASGDAGKAKVEADAAAQDLLTLKDRLAKVKATDANSGRGDGASAPGERLERLRDAAASLSQDSGLMMDSLAGKAESLQRLQDQVLHKSETLQGLDTKLQGLLSAIRAKAHLLATCS